MAITFQRNIIGSSTIQTQYRVFTRHQMQLRFRCLLCALVVVAPNNHTTPNSQPQPHHLSSTNHGFHLAALSSTEVHWGDELEKSTRQGPFHQYLDFWLPRVIFYTDASLSTWEESLPHLRNLLDWIWPHSSFFLPWLAIPAEFQRNSANSEVQKGGTLKFFWFSSNGKMYHDFTWRWQSSKTNNWNPVMPLIPPIFKVRGMEIMIGWKKCGHTQHTACMLIVVCCRWCHHPHIRLLLIIYCIRLCS